MIPRILIIPPMRPWYMEAHAEYLIRHLSDEFFIEVAEVPYPPYENFIGRFPETSPFMRSPDDYDLIWPILPSHWGITEKEKYSKKVCMVWYQPNEGGYYEDLAGLAAATDKAEESMKNYPHHRVRFGVDTDLFKPFSMVCDDNLLHVGMVGTLLNPRRITPQIVNAFKGVEGVKLELFPNIAPRTEKELNEVGGDLSLIQSGDKFWPGLPNIYNRLDILLRVDSDPGYSFPVTEAAACGVPVITTDGGIDNIITDAGGGYLIKGNRDSYQADLDGLARQARDQVLFLKDKPELRKMMGQIGRSTVEKYFKWETVIPAWREFFREGVKNAHRNS